MRGRRIVAAMTAAVVVLALPAGAHAASISFNGNVLTYDGGAVANQVSFTVHSAADFGCGETRTACIDVQEGGTSTVTFPADRCNDDGLYTVECDLPASVVVRAGDGDDTVFAGDLPTTIDGGGGNEVTLKGGAASDTISGGPGNDSIFGMGGDDTIDAGDGDDLMEGFGGLSPYDPDATRGRDSYIGGPGKDFVEYAGRTDGLTISLDGAANDGAAGEGDNVGADVEWVRGGNAADTISGNGAGNQLDGWQGDDTIRGGAGDDFVFGRAGADKVFGEGGQDAIEGGEGDDQVDGGDATDVLYGDELQTCIPGDCATGRDTIAARDGVKDEVFCGPGQDTAVVDTIDNVSTSTQDGCEAVDAAGGDGGDTAAPALRKLKVGRLDLDRGTVIRFTLSEAATIGLRVERKVGRRWKKVKGRLSAPGAAGSNRVRFDGRVGGKALKPGRYRLVLVATDAAGNRTKAKRAAFKVVR